MTTSDAVVIVRGIPEGSRRDVARLYWEAFGRKLAPSLGDRERGEKYLESQLNASGFVCASVSGRIVGVIGFYDQGRPAVGFSYRELARQYSVVSAPWRTAILALLSRRPHTGELLLDGLAVDAEARGLGIGTRLLAEAGVLAQERGLREVRLSVVDTNPRAKSLYERLGFVATQTESLGFLGSVFGFQRATNMVFRLPQAAAQ